MTKTGRSDKMAKKTMYPYAVIEDGGGGLSLYVFDPADRKRVLWAHSGYEYCEGQLAQDLEALAHGTDIGEWDGGEADPQASWEYWTPKNRTNGGWSIVADEDGWAAEERMGAAARAEYRAAQEANALRAAIAEAEGK